MKLEHCAEPSRGQKRKRDHSEEMFALAALIFPRTSLNPFKVLKMEKAPSVKTMKFKVSKMEKVPSVKTMKLEPKDDEQLKEELDSTIQPNSPAEQFFRLLKTEKELQAAQGGPCGDCGSVVTTKKYRVGPHAGEMRWHHDGRCNRCHQKAMKAMQWGTGGGLLA